MGMGLEPMSISVRNESGRRGVRTGSIEDWEFIMSRAADAEAVGSPESLRPKPSTSKYVIGDFDLVRLLPGLVCHQSHTPKLTKPAVSLSGYLSL